MDKKLFSFSALCISLVIGLLCMVNAMSRFAVGALPGDRSDVIVLGVFMLLLGLGLLAAAAAGIALFVIFTLKKKEMKLPGILAIVCAGLLLTVYCIISMVVNIKDIVNCGKALSDDAGDLAAYYGMSIFVDLCSLFTDVLVSLIVAALAALSFITFKRKPKAEPQPEPVQEVSEEPAQEQAENQ